MSKEDIKLAEEFEKLRYKYKHGFLVEDTKAFEEFCFANSDEISTLLKKAIKRTFRRRK